MIGGKPIIVGRQNCPGHNIQIQVCNQKHTSYKHEDALHELHHQCESVAAGILYLDSIKWIFNSAIRWLSLLTNSQPSLLGNIVSIH